MDLQRFKDKMQTEDALPLNILLDEAQNVVHKNGSMEVDAARELMLKSYKLSKLSGRIVFFNAYDDTAGKIWPQLCLELTDTEEIYDLIMTTNS